MHTGGGEGTSANSFRLPRCKSRRKSRSQLKMKPCLQIRTCAFMARLGRAIVKSRKSNSAQMAEQHGAKLVCLAHPNRMRGGFGNLIGKRTVRRESERSLLARLIRSARLNRHIAILIEVRI